MDEQTRRLFIALPVDDEKSIKSLHKVYKHLKKYEPSLKIVPSDNYHITVKFFGPVESVSADSIINSFSSLNRLKKIEYKIEGIGAFPSMADPSVIWAGLKCDEDSLMELFRTVEIFAASFGFPSEKRKFIPHLTLARVKKVKELPSELKNFLIEEQNSLFTVSILSKLVLYESILKSSGAEYRRVETINLI